MEPVKLTFKYTQNEFVKAERQYLFASKTITKVSIVIGVLYLIFSIFYLFLTSFSVLGIVAIVVALFAMTLGSYIYFIAPVYKFKNVSKYQEKYHLAFTHDDIHFQTPSIDSRLKWNIYSEVWENDSFYYLIQIPRVYTIIPKRVFEDSSIIHTFEELIASNIKSIKRNV